jgi:hypothetical protein
MSILETQLEHLIGQLERREARRRSGLVSLRPELEVTQNHPLPTQEAAEGERFWHPGDGCPAGHETDAYGSCLGPCAGEVWD